MTSLFDSQTIQKLAIWSVNAVMAGIIAVWLYALYRTVRRVADQISPSEKRPTLEKIPEVNVLAVRTSWYEAHFVSITAMIAFLIIPWFTLVRFQALEIAYFAPTLVGLVSVTLIWLNCHIGKLQLTDKRAIKYGGIFGDPPIAIGLKEILSIELESKTLWERKFELPTIIIEGGGASQRDPGSKGQ